MIQDGFIEVTIKEIIHFIGGKRESSTEE